MAVYYETTIQSMEQVCATYGILSALMLAMNVASFGSMELDECELLARVPQIRRALCFS